MVLHMFRLLYAIVVVTSTKMIEPSMQYARLPQRARRRPLAVPKVAPPRGSARACDVRHHLMRCVVEGRHDMLNRYKPTRERLGENRQMVRRTHTNEPTT